MALCPRKSRLEHELRVLTRAKRYQWSLFILVRDGTGVCLWPFSDELELQESDQPWSLAACMYKLSGPKASTINLHDSQVARFLTFQDVW
jgi:hypothetical protein